MLSTKISVIIPVYNKENRIERTIESILSQEFDSFEIILVDDRSQDASVSIIERLKFRDPRIKLIKLESNSGPMFARMEGCKSSVGDYIVFCDADDTLPPDALHNLYTKIVDVDADIVFADYSYFTLSGEIEKRRSLLPYGYEIPSVYKALLDWKCPQSLWGKIFKRAIIINPQYIIVKNMNNGEDGWMLYQILRNTRHVSLLEQSVYNYIEDNNSTTHQTYSDKTLVEVIRSNVERVNIAMKYPGMRNMTQWLYDGYSSTLIWETYQKNGGDKTLIGFKSFISYFSYREILKIITKILYGKIFFRNRQR